MNLILQTWDLYEKGELVELVDITIGKDVNIDEACRFLKIGLLCTQDLTKLRPLMSNVVKMLTGQIDIDGKIISKPGLLSQFSGITTKNTSSTSSTTSLSANMSMSYATMSFESIFDRSNRVE